MQSADIYLQDRSLRDWLNETGAQALAENRLSALLTHWAQHSAKPIVLMLDEVDALIGDTLISLLRQLRGGYGQRPAAFPQSVILCGVRDVRDYRIHSSNHEIITGGSAFNIKSESLRMGNFSFEEVKALYQQHTDETGQPFEPAIFPELWEDTCGQPWLVNALGHELTWKDRAARDRTKTITLVGYQAARERLIQSRATHLDQLADKLREPRVNQIIAALLGGGRVNREYGLGRKRTDLLLEWPIDLGQGYLGPVQRIVIELKLLRKALDKTLAEGLAQTADYADRVNADEAHLVIFNRDTATPWDDKIWQRREHYLNHRIDVWGA